MRPKNTLWIGAILWTTSLTALQFGVERTQFWAVLGAFAISFVGYFLLIKNEKTPISLAILLRFVLIFGFPNLSDDVFRFGWDGALMAIGQNPFAQTPTQMLPNMTDPFFYQIFPQLNSPNYTTVYPLGVQVLFAACFWASGGAIFWFSVLLKSIFFIFDVHTIFQLSKLQKMVEKTPPPSIPFSRLSWSALYAFNPLIIIELMGNLHLEVLMIWGVVFWISNWWRGRFWAAVLGLSVAIQAKLLPLMFLPILCTLFGFWRGGLAILSILGISLLSFLPFLHQNLGSGFQLYYNKFEFNASLYYGIRAVGYAWTGVHPPLWVSPALGILGGGIILGISAWTFFKNTVKNFHQNIRPVFWTYAIFLMVTPTVHPWYVLLLFVLGILAKYYFPIVWTFLIILTYSIYDFGVESLPFVCLEYSLVVIAAVLELKFKKNKEEFNL